MKNIVKLDCWVDAMAIDNKKIWFIDGMTTGVFKTDLTTGETEHVAKIPNKVKNIFRAFSGGIFYKGNCFFMPFNADVIIVYDTQSQKIKEISIDGLVIEKAQFSNIIIKDNILYAIATYKNHLVLKMNISKGDIEVIDFNYLEINNKNITRDAINYKNKIIWGAINTPFLLVLETNDKKVKLIDTHINNGIGTIATDNQSVIISSRDGVYRLNEKDYSCKKICNYPSQMRITTCKEGIVKKEAYYVNSELSWEQPFFKSVIINNSLILIPAETDNFLCLKINEPNKVDIIELSELFEDRVYSLDGHISILKFLSVVNDENTIVMYSDYYSCLCVMEIDENVIFNYKELWMKKDYLKRYLFDNNSVLFETKRVGIDVFLEMIL